MDDEFKLCWKNFQDNIASGFQSLYDRGDLVDVTLACDGKLLQAHKIVLAICSPYFQEIFISNPCKHPIIILKDVTYNIMCELLEFMYQGVVNVKHTELQAFMKIGQLLQIKGLATNSSSSAASTSSDKSSNYNHSNKENDVETSFTAKPVVATAIESANNDERSNNVEKASLGNSNPNTPQRSQSPALQSPASPTNAALNVERSMNAAHKSQDSQLPLHHPYLQSAASSGSGLKRHSDYNSDSLSIFSRNKLRRSLTSTDHSSENNDGHEGGGVGGGMDQMNAEDFFMPHISMVESRYGLNTIKRESSEHHQNPDGASAAAVAAAASASLRNSFNSAAFGLDYTFYKNNSGSAQSGQEYPNDLHLSNEYSKSFANHMDIPPNCPNVVMLSSTSLLHGSCVFNRNNTVATQQGMKTYWLCKSYRISMCRARCITHQGKIISATGVHNHAPHMRGNNTGGVGGGSGVASGNGSNSGANSANNSSNNNNGVGPPTSLQTPSNSGSGLSAASGTNVLGFRFPPTTGSSGTSQNHHQNFHDQHSSSSPPPMYGTHAHMHVNNGDHNTSMASQHHYLQSMPNLLVQHQHAGQSTQQMQQHSPHLTMPPSQNSGVVQQQQHMMHSGGGGGVGGIHHSPQTLSNFDLSPANMQASPSEHSSFDPSEKTYNSLNKDHLNDDHIIVRNAASPPAVHPHNELDPTNPSQTHDNEIITKMTSSEHHQQAQIIDTIEMSPNCGHNFKLESM